jgi:hypothetical protein
MFPMDRKALNQPVTVEYSNARGERVRKTLPDSFSARRFYARMLRDGRNPKVVANQPA